VIGDIRGSIPFGLVAAKLREIAPGTFVFAFDPTLRG